MNKKQLIYIPSISFLLSFIILSNIYIQINTPITYSGGITNKEYETINFIKDNIEDNSFIFTDLRLSSILRSQTNLTIIAAPGSASSSYFEINVTYHAFYSNNSFLAYYCIKMLISQYFKYLEIKNFYVFFSKLYVLEGFTTLDFTFGPIPIESYNKYLNSTYFNIIFQNDQCFIVKAE